MACAQTLKGIVTDCLNSVGGIKAVYIANYDDVTGVTDSEGVITAVTLASSTATPFIKYEFRKETGSMTSTLNVDEKVGLNYVSTELSLVFTRMETAKRIEMAALAVGQLVVIVLDSNGVYWYLGEDDYVSATTGTASTGTAKTDGSSYTITLGCESKSFPKEISKDAVEKVVKKTA